MNWSAKPNQNSARENLREALPLVILIVFSACLFYQLLSTHMLQPKADGLYSGGSTWGDLAWHLSMISNFIQRGSVTVPEALRKYMNNMERIEPRK